ncbi:unnamed protein product [Rhizophagus irregularis]|nr:unnamed protein product [Rhizophagus irregularis]
MARQKEFYQIANNAREMHPPCINRQVWMDKPCKTPYGRSLTPPLNKYQDSVRDVPHSSTPNILFISSQYAKQPKGTALRLRDGTVIMIV